jgi:hypothetical protein
MAVWMPSPEDMKTIEKKAQSSSDSGAHRQASSVDLHARFTAAESLLKACLCGGTLALPRAC